MRNVTLILDDGSRFSGKSFGYEKPVAGEVVFNTAMTGYPESLTDPSYAGQLMTLTYPLVGNYGVPPFTVGPNGLAVLMESERIHAEAIIVSDYSENYSHWNAVESLGDWLKREQIPGITGIDTRELTKVLREHGVMMGKIVFDDDPDNQPEARYEGINYVDKVSCKEVIRYNEGADKKKVVLVAPYLAEDYVKEAHKPYVDGVHLDYVRMPDVVLPVSLWKNYGIEQKEELPEYDYCYCDTCRALFKAKTGQDPLELKYPMENQSWINFRLDAVTHVVEAITKAVKADHKFISAAVFPGPSMARKMVRQDWGNWSLDAYFPMIYNKFYYEGAEWIGRSVQESVQTVNGRAKVYAGLMFGDIKDDFEKALDEAYGNGASGVSFFAGPDEEYLRRFKAYLDKRGFIVK